MMQQSFLSALIILLPVFGSVFASFFAAQIMRSNDITKVRDLRSACDHCGTSLLWFELVPVVSYILQRGKCRKCGHSIDRRIWIAELLGLVLSMILGIGLGNGLAARQGVEQLIWVLFPILLGIVFLYCSIYDIFTYTIPDVGLKIGLVITMLANILVWALRQFQVTQLPNLDLGNLANIFAALIYAGFFYLIIKLSKQKGMGIGDVYLVAIVGLALGAKASIISFYGTIFSASIVGLWWAWLKGKLKGEIIPLVPFIAFGFVIAYSAGDSLFRLIFWTLN